MDSTRFSDFQERTTSAIASLAVERRVAFERIDAVADIAFISRDPMPVIEARIGRLIVWLWDDEASVKIVGTARDGAGFERLDYPSLEALETALLDYVKRYM